MAGMARMLAEKRPRFVPRKPQVCSMKPVVLPPGYGWIVGKKDVAATKLWLTFKNEHDLEEHDAPSNFKEDKNLPLSLLESQDDAANAAVEFWKVYKKPACNSEDGDVTEPWVLIDNEWFKVSLFEEKELDKIKLLLKSDEEIDGDLDEVKAMKKRLQEATDQSLVVSVILEKAKTWDVYNSELFKTGNAEVELWGRKELYWDPLRIMVYKGKNLEEQTSPLLKTIQKTIRTSKVSLWKGSFDFTGETILYITGSTKDRIPAIVKGLKIYFKRKFPPALVPPAFVEKFGVKPTRVSKSFYETLVDPDDEDEPIAKSPFLPPNIGVFCYIPEDEEEELKELKVYAAVRLDVKEGNLVHATKEFFFNIWLKLFYCVMENEIETVALFDLFIDGDSVHRFTLMRHLISGYERAYLVAAATETFEMPSFYLVDTNRTTSEMREMFDKFAKHFGMEIVAVDSFEVYLEAESRDPNELVVFSVTPGAVFGVDDVPDSINHDVGQVTQFALQALGVVNTQFTWRFLTKVE